MKYVENQKADAQINKISKYINTGLTDKQISNLFDGKQDNLKSGDKKWNENDIKEIRENFKLTKEVSDVPVVVFFMIRLIQLVKSWTARISSGNGITKRDGTRTYSVADELLKWNELKKQGVVSEAEYDEAKKKILGD